MNSLQNYVFPTIPPNKTQKNLHTFQTIPFYPFIKYKKEMLQNEFYNISIAVLLWKAEALFAFQRYANLAR